MAEVFGVVVSAFTVVEIAGKLGSSTIKLKKLWDEVQEVPSEMNQLVGMVDILNATLTELDRAFDKAGDPNFGTLDVSLNWCQQAATDLDTLATDLQQQIATAKRFRRRITKLKVTFKKDLIRSCEQKVQTALQILSLSLSTRIYIDINAKPQPYSVQANIAGSNLPLIETSPCQHVGFTQGPIIGSNAAINVARKSRKSSVLQTRASIFGSFVSQSVPHPEFPEVQIYQAQLQLPCWISATIWNIQVYNAYAGWKHSLRAWTVRPDDTPIFRYIKENEWENALCDIKEGRASLFDRDEDGRTLLHIAVDWERLSIVHHLLSMGLNLSDLRDHVKLLQFEGFIDGPSDVLELFKIWIYVALDDSLEEYCAPGETTMNLSAISSFVWNAPEALQYMKRSLVVTATQLPLTARFAHLDWSQINPQILLEDIQHDKDLQPEDFCATIEKSQNGSLGRFARNYRFYIVDNENYYWRGLARWIFKGTSLERLSMQESSYAGEGQYTPLFIGIFDMPWNYVNIGRCIHKLLRMWLEDMQTSSIDLDEYGRREMEVFKRDALLQERRLRIRSTRDDGYYESYPGMRLTSFTYGPEPEDWKLVWSPEAEEYAGEFWDLIENPPLRIPGGWVDDDL
ncbi:hypothetical protein BDP55DRAFT_655910 [Colletotrichum godetiae]|uniref:Fungal N-terminal domain-containing protein n=1 Tax=Colletotrichum godetiae TaxID=1209918 RepID=A0AAJ0AQC5_9PEZI|nr:uncharacterized protein BDP55DRAFT_655910 [Colletotrichum godetiae]KAK1688432.1 hypothetical protein BDP55DRAFT_655910 [Colletotrichum godetiae]